MNTQYRKNLKAVLEASKTYADNKIEDLKWELGTYDLSVDTIDGTTMLLPTPANAIQSTMVRVEGKSEKSENLLVIADGNINIGSLVFAFSNGICNSSGTTSDTGWIRVKSFTLNAGTYYFADLGSGTPKLSLIDSNYQALTNFTLNASATVYLAITGNSITNTGQLVNSKPMLITGSTAPTEFKVGYTNIHNFEWTGVKVSADLFNTTVESGIFDNGGNKAENTRRLRTADKISLNAGTYTLSFSGVDSVAIYIFNTSDVLQNTPSWNDTNQFTFTVDYDFKCNFAWRKTTNDTLTPTDISNIILNKGTTVIQPTTKTIDLSTILYNGNPLFEGNSLKAVGTAKDYITPYKPHKEIKTIVLDGSDTTGWSINTTSGNYTLQITVDDILTTGDRDLIIASYLDSSATAYNDNTINRYNNVLFINIGGNTLTSVNAYATYLQNKPLTIQYILATPIEVSIDWSDKLIKQTCYSNGSTILLNTNNQDTTSQIDYLKEVAK